MKVPEYLFTLVLFIAQKIKLKKQSKCITNMDMLRVVHIGVWDTN